MSGFERARSRAHHLPTENATRVILRATGLEDRQKIDPFTVSRWFEKFNEHYYFGERSNVTVDDTGEGLLIDAIHYTEERGRSLGKAEDLLSRTAFMAQEVILDATDQRPINLVGARMAPNMFNLKTEAAWEEMGIEGHDHSDELVDLNERVQAGFQSHAHVAMDQQLVAAS